MSANHATGGVRPSVGLFSTELAHEECSHCHVPYPALAECVCVYCDAQVCPSCVELIEEIDEVVCLRCGGSSSELKPVPAALKGLRFEN